MTLQSNIEYIRYNEASNLPKFKAALGRLINRRSFNFCLSCESLSDNELMPFIEKALSEGNGIIIQKEYNGYFVTLWKD